MTTKLAIIGLLSLLVLGPSICNAHLVDSLLQSLQRWFSPAVSHSHTADGPTCLNAEGSFVDWWMTIKLPGNSDLAYIDSQTAAELGEGARFRHMLAHESSALNRTLRQLYAAESSAHSGSTTLGSAGHIMYSDEPPMVEGLSDEDSFGFAFTQGKGVMGYGQDQGFWLVHSVPSFPAAPRKASYSGLPRREAGNAHTFLCMSATTHQLSATSAVLLTNAYYVYSEAAPEQARAGLTDAQRTAFPDLVGSEPHLDAAKTGSDVKATEFSTLGGERFLVFANGGQRPGVRVMRDIVESYFGSGMLYSNPPPDQGNEAPCDVSAAVFPSLMASEYYMEDAGVAWSAAEDRSTWAITLGGCTNAGSGTFEQVPEEDPVGLGGAGKEVLAVEDTAALADKARPMWSQTMTYPVTSASRRHLLTSADPLPDHHSEAVIPAWFAHLAARINAWWRAIGIATAEDTRDDTSALPAVPLYTPPVGSSPSVAAEILTSRSEAADGDVDQIAADVAWQEMMWQESHEGSMLPQQPEMGRAMADLEEGPLGVWRVNGVASSDGEELEGGSDSQAGVDADEEAYMAIPELGQPDQVNPKCVGTGCDLVRLAKRMTAVEEKLQRLEDLLVEADDDVNWDEGDEEGEEDEAVDYEEGRIQQMLVPCKQLAAQRSVVCVHDAGRSLQSADLPGGAVCFAGNAALWAALRDLMQTAETASEC
ncbi:g10086 [Coccomyxa elongata]